jgi:hypothetical protein
MKGKKEVETKKKKKNLRRNEEKEVERKNIGKE